jgi:uncharacterized membrane protein
MDMPEGNAMLATEASSASRKPAMTGTTDGATKDGILRSSWIAIGRALTLVYRALLLCLIAGAALLACANGVAALGSAAGLPPLPEPLAIIGERLPAIFRLHMISGGLGLILLPWLILLRHRRHVHRSLGRAVLGLLCAAALTGLPSAIASVAPPVARIGFFTQGVLTLYFLTAGFAAIRRGERQAHMRLMAFAIAMTSGVIVLRIMLYCAAILQLDFGVAYAAIAWLAWGLPLAAMAMRNAAARTARQLSYYVASRYFRMPA